MMQSIRNSIFVIAGLFLLAGCGGGGGGAPATPNVPVVNSLATITSQNAPLAAGVAADTALNGGFYSSFFGQTLPIASSGPTRILSGVAKASNPSNFLWKNSGIEPCVVSGTVNVEVTAGNPLAPAVGDQFLITFETCNDGTGTVISGSMGITITALGGDLTNGNILIGMSVEVTAMTVTEGGDTTMASGTISITIDMSAPPVTTITVSISALATTTNGTTEAVSNMTVTITEDESMFPTAVTVETSFRISSPRLGGDVVVSTSLALQSMGAEYPFVGELRIMGAGNAVVVLIALDSNTVRLEIDIDGDGAVDETVDTTWDEIVAAAAA